MESKAELKHMSKEDVDVMEKYRNFKKFDIVKDDECSDHYYSKENSKTMQASGYWTKKIQQEWKILNNHLPDMIFVRVYESRMDLLRAVIIGAEGTPYHNGLFFFDVCFPKSYPHRPPKVYYRSGGLHINPNLYENGYVCLSLLNTWSGGRNEKWTPGVSTMLQVLVSIQGLVLNAKPFFNEPHFAFSVDLENESLEYNESTFALSLKTMVYTMKKPPKHFEDLVIGHFRDRARDILTRCEAYYIEGIGVNSSGDHEVKVMLSWWSWWTRIVVERYMKTLVESFKQIGVEDVEQFVPPTSFSIRRPLLWELLFLTVSVFFAFMIVIKCLYIS